MTAADRLNLVRPAHRRARPGRLLLAGPSGSGKTFTALVIAKQLVGPDGRIVVVDTEHESAELYTDQFHPFDVLPWDPPYDPRELASAIAEISAKTDVLIVDSGSHFWSKTGGTLDIVDGKFGGWKVGTPAQEDMVEAILSAKCHVIFCVRSKMAHAQETDPATGKQVVRKLGLAPVQRDDLEYEMTASADLDMEHRLSIGKSRCAAIAGRTYSPGHAGEMAKAFGDWLASAEPVASRAHVDELVARMNAIGDEAARIAAKRVFVERFGKPEFLLESQLAEATAFVTASEQPDPQPPVEPEPTPPPAAHSPPPPPVPAPIPAAAGVNGNGNGHAPVSRVAGVTISGKMASGLHRRVAEVAKELGRTKTGAKAGSVVADTAWSEATLDALVRSATNGRSDSAIELTVDEHRRVEGYVAALAAGTMTSAVEDNGNVRLVVGDQTYRFVRTPNDGLVHVGALAS